MPTRASDIRREHVEAFIADLLERYKPATASNRYRAVQSFFRWALEDGEIRDSPMARMRPPTVPEAPPAVLTEEELRKLLTACEGRTFEDRRDAAILRLFLDSGLRLSELAGLRARRRRPRRERGHRHRQGAPAARLPVRARTAQALDRYLRIRAGHREASRPHLWLGLAGPMTPNGIADAVRRRRAAASVRDVHPHRFRHTYAING
jgi:site-specific recombinase XerD